MADFAIYFADKTVLSCRQMRQLTFNVAETKQTLLETLFQNNAILFANNLSGRLVYFCKNHRERHRRKHVYFAQNVPIDGKTICDECVLLCVLFPCAAFFSPISAQTQASIHLKDNIEQTEKINKKGKEQKCYVFFWKQKLTMCVRKSFRTICSWFVRSQ